ncbi:ferredoxin reductase-like protein [Thozetella sp. PMI_491]|nr:ferredoxin reductase-like protein [Thozetella sp. PMI_491]
MEVVAVSRSLPQWLDINGQRILTSIIHNPLTGPEDYIELHESGISGNKTAVHDGPVYGFFAEHYDYWCEKLGVDRTAWDWCHWGENITFRSTGDGADNPTGANMTEHDMHLGDIWAVGDSVRLQLALSRNVWEGWRRFRPRRIVDEGDGVKSFYLVAIDRQPLAHYCPGQFLTVQLPDTNEIRSWSISDWARPGSDDGVAQYRLTIKRAENASRWMCDECTPDTVLKVRSPAGQFVLDWSHLVPPRQVYVSAGIGITPILAMMKAHKAHPNMDVTPGLWIHVTSNSHSFPLRQEGIDIANGLISRALFFTRPLETDVLGEHFDHMGRPTMDVLKDLLAGPYLFNPLGISEIEVPGPNSCIYICGPRSFEEDMRSNLLNIGVPAPLIHSESFTGNGGVAADTCLEVASVRFTKSKVVGKWEREKPQTLLELAESLGLAPNFGCRAGSCGSCAAKLVAGSVSGGLELDGRVLICTAHPATAEVELEI